MSPFDQEPPQWALKLLRFYCKPRALEIIEGDAYELFYKRIETVGLKKARRQFSWDVFRFFRLKYIKGLEDFNSLNNIAMFKNYFKISVRSLLRQRFYSAINISGLAIGLAACLLITMYISHELSYDNFHKDVDRIYRVANGQSGAYTPARMGIQMKIDFPEIEEVARLNGPFDQKLKVGDQIFKEARGFSADSTFSKIFTVQFLEGNPNQALSKPNSIVLTKALADKLFDFGEAIGQVIEVDNQKVQVTGVVADPPKNTHFYYSYISSYPDDPWVTVGNWTGNNFFTYVKLAKGATVAQINAKIPDFVAQYIGPELVKYTGHDTFEDFIAAGGKKTYAFLPMQSLHLHYPHLALGSSGNIDNVYIFSAVALFILIIACINFMNLSTARSAMRSKEVGMRKVLGSLRSQLIGQFMVESILVCFLSSILALGMASLALDGFNSLANRNFEFSELFDSLTLLKLFGLMILVGLLAGAYPALVISSFKPIKALKGEAQTGSKSSALLRKGLVAFQFAISILLIVCTVVVFSQLNFIKKQELGFETEQVLIVKNTSLLEEKSSSFLNQIDRISTIEKRSFSSNYLSGRIPDYGYQTLEDNPRALSFINLFATENYLETMNMELVAGRGFNKELVSDTANILINEQAQKWLGGDVLGKKLSRGDGEDYTVIGVVKNFNYASLRGEIQPFVFRLMEDDGRVEEDWYQANYLSIKVSGDYQNTVSQVREAWSQTLPSEPFEYVFLDDAFDSLYKEEERFGSLFTASSGLAIIIACLGLFALAAFTLQRRHKEIAVRKVLGASVQSLTLMVISNFTILVGLGALAAIPVGYLLMKEWLATFAYQLNLNNPLIWIIPVISVAIIAWLTVGFQSIRTATSNPINALRSE